MKKYSQCHATLFISNNGTDNMLKKRPSSNAIGAIRSGDKKQRKHCERHDERVALPNELKLAKGMEVMIIFNVETDLDMANRARGEVTEIVLDSLEIAFSPTTPIVELTYPPAYIFGQMNRTKAVQLEGLEKDALPLVLREHTFTIVHVGKG